MSIDTVAPPAATTMEPPAAVCPLLSRDQYFTLDRLRSLLERRDALDAERLTPALEDQPWLVRALDAAIVSYYRLAHGLGWRPTPRGCCSATVNWVWAVPRNHAGM